MITRALALASVLLLLASTGCYHFHLQSPDRDPATPWSSKTAYALAWGGVQPRLTANDCVGELDQVRASTNFVYLLAGVLSLGIVVPLQVEWRCAKEPPRVGTL